MIEGIELIFADMKAMLRKLKKKNYEQQMAVFRETHGHFFEEMDRLVRESDDKTQTAQEIANIFVEKVCEHYSKNGKMRGTMEIDLSMFMIYYVFPAILLLETEETVIIADALKHTWAEKFKNPNFSYTTYDRIYSNFREKIFGIF